MSNGAASKAGYVDAVAQSIESLREDLMDISLDIHSHPELNYQHRVYGRGK